MSVTLAIDAKQFKSLMTQISEELGINRDVEMRAMLAEAMAIGMDKLFLREWEQYGVDAIFDPLIRLAEEYLEGLNE